MKNCLLVLVAAFVMVGCKTTNPKASYSSDVNFSGVTHTNEKLRNDSYNMLRMYMSADGCREITRVNSTVTLPPEGAEGRKLSKEQWEVVGCGKTYNFELAFTEDGKGGAFFSVKKL
ncbi:hypothetical protein [Pleionea sediminis]|uniref:hypothetical protein n=1 Tax=Pleionea sediminis TaxID=2569479 RepID=UPI001186DE38|nr:hypothetical protein [Pleionea sediminis]